MPAPSFLIRQTVEIFINQSLLMSADESHEQHCTRRKEESSIVETDKAHTDGLFKGCFETLPRVKYIVDPSDGVTRCPDCNWEIEDDACPQCGLEFDADGYAILEDQLHGGNPGFSDIGSDGMDSDTIAELYDMELDHSLASEDDEDDDEDDDSLDLYGIHGHQLFHHGPDMNRASHLHDFGGPMPPRRHFRYAQGGDELSSNDEDDDMQQFLEDDEDDEDDEDVGSLQDFVVDDDDLPQDEPRRNASGASTASLNTRPTLHSVLSDGDDDGLQAHDSDDSSDGEGNIISSQHKSRASRATGKVDRPVVIDSDSESEVDAHNSELHNENQSRAVERFGWSPLDEGNEQSVNDQSSNTNNSDSDITIGESEADKEEGSATPQYDSSRYFGSKSDDNHVQFREASTISSSGRSQTSDPEEGSDGEVSEVTDQDGDVDMGRSLDRVASSRRVSNMFAAVGGTSRGQKRASGSEDEESDGSILPARRRRRQQQRHHALPERQPARRPILTVRRRRTFY